MQHWVKDGQDDGGSLLELMVVVLITAIMAVMTIPLLHQQIVVREIDMVARRFIAHAQFARAQALTLGIPVQITPLYENLWDGGWVVKSPCQDHQLKSICTAVG